MKYLPLILFIAALLSLHTFRKDPASQELRIQRFKGHENHAWERELLLDFASKEKLKLMEVDFGDWSENGVDLYWGISKEAETPLLKSESYWTGHWVSFCHEGSHEEVESVLLQNSSIDGESLSESKLKTIFPNAAIMELGAVMSSKYKEALTKHWVDCLILPDEEILSGGWEEDSYHVQLIADSRFELVFGLHPDSSQLLGKINSWIRSRDVNESILTIAKRRVRPEFPFLFADFKQ